MARRTLSTLLLSLALLLAGCNEVTGPVAIKGAGATAPNLVYAKWVTEFKKADGSVDLDYQATGSGDGIRQLTEGTVDFAATDMPLADTDLQKLKVKPLYFPTLTGAIVPVYNLTGITKELHFSGAILAGIFSGKIKTWSDDAIERENTGIPLPAKPITVVHRSDSSGSTWAFFTVP